MDYLVSHQWSYLPCWYTAGVHCSATDTETWLRYEIPTDVVNINGYICHRKDRPGGRCGGDVAVYVRDDLLCHGLNTYEQIQFDVIWLLFRTSRMPRTVSHIAVAAVYHPPAANGRTLITYLVDFLDQLNRHHPYAGCTVVRRL